MEAYFPLDGGAGDIVKEEIKGLNGTLNGMQNKAETDAAWISSKLGGALPHSQHIITKGDYHSAAPDQTGKRWEMFMSSRGVNHVFFFCFSTLFLNIFLCRILS